MKTFKIFSMAALALVMAACSSDDNEIQQPAQQGPMHFTATLAAPNSGATTRTTGAQDGSNINVAWAVNDEIALVYENKDGDRVWDQAVVTEVDGSGNATIEATLNYSVNDNTPVTLVYPYDIVVNADIDVMSGKNYHFDESKFFGQSGSSLADGFTAGFDWRDGDGTFSVSGSGVTLSGNVSMNSNVAIWKINLTSDGTTPLDVFMVLLNIGTTSGIVTANPSNSSTLYLFVPPILLNHFYTYFGSGSLFSITAMSFGPRYTYSYNSQVSLTAGKIYESTLKLTAFQEGWILDSSDEGDLIYYTAGESWANAIANHPADNSCWEIKDGKVYNNFQSKYLKNAAGDAYIDPTSAIDPDVKYSWVD